MRQRTIPNGNAGQFSTDGSIVYYGNWTVGMLERSTGSYGDLCEGWPGGELSPGLLGVTSSLDVSNPQWRRFYSQPAVMGSPRVEIPVPQDTVPRYACLGHVYGVRPGKWYPDGQAGDYFFKDGLEFFPQTQKAIAGIMLAGNFFLTFRPNTPLVPTWIYTTDGAFVREVSLAGTGANDVFQRYTQLRQGPHVDAYAIFNAPAGMFMNAPDNANYPVAPLLNGESLVGLVWWQDVSYAVTIAIPDYNKALVMVRPVDGSWGPLAICVLMPVQYLQSMVAADGELLLAGMDNAAGPNLNSLTVTDEIWIATANREDPHSYLPGWTGPPPTGPGGTPPTGPVDPPPTTGRVIDITGPLHAGDVIRII